MSQHLYVVQHEIDGERYISACVGDDELKVHAEMAEHFGAQLLAVTDLEWELERFVWMCCFEGLSKGWGGA